MGKSPRGRGAPRRGPAARSGRLPGGARRRGPPSANHHRRRGGVVREETIMTFALNGTNPASSPTGGEHAVPIYSYTAWHLIDPSAASSDPSATASAASVDSIVGPEADASVTLTPD